MTSIDETSDRLLTEVERQQKYLARLPENYEFPLFNAAQALESQRRSGYRNTAAAAREIIDNAMEAGATRVDVCFGRPKQHKPHQRSESINAVAFIDNGSGMLPKMAQYALSWGAGTHFDEPNFIGKFGFGLPNASINQTRHVEVYTRITGAAAITKASLDVREVRVHGLQTIPDPTEGTLPEFVQAYLDRQGLAFDHGTVVVWLEPDRVTYRTAAVLKQHLMDDFGVTYRHLLDDVGLYVEGAKVEPVDPLFLTENARYFLPEERGGAILSADWNIPIKYVRNPYTGQNEFSKIADESELDRDDPNLIAADVIHVRVSRFPYGFAKDSGGGKAETDAHRRFEIRKTRRGMSFVRAGREIETVDVFPKSMKDVANGLGRWPLLQSYAYHWGVEVRFSPALDEVFGITNDKQTVRPIEELWRLFASEEIDAALNREQAFQRTNRREEKEKQRQAEARKAERKTKAEVAAARADSIGGQKPKVADHAKEKARQNLDMEAKRLAKVDQISIDNARKALEEEAKRRPYVIDFYDELRGPFYKPEWNFGRQISVRINRQHPFFQVLYAPMLKLENADDAKQALDLLLIALARAELGVADEEAALWYETQRERHWSVFLADAYKLLQQTTAAPDEETEASETEPSQTGEGGTATAAKNLETAA